jgi:AraC-like DNA-binding protein
MRTVQIWKSPPILRMITFSPHHRTNYGRRHDHPFYELALVLGGRCAWRLGMRRPMMLRTGDALLLKPGLLHWEEIAPGEEARVAWLGFELTGPAPKWCQSAIALGDDAAEIFGYFQAISREHPFTDSRSQMRIDLALQSLLLLLERRAEGASPAAAASSALNPRQTHTVETAAHYFRRNLRDPLSVAQLAAYHSLCPAHFSSLFQRHHRVSPRRYLRQARLERASDLLGESELTLKEIAAECGFVDAAHLCKSFKLDHRVTPGAFRRRMRQGRAPFPGGRKDNQRRTENISSICAGELAKKNNVRA